MKTQEYLGDAVYFTGTANSITLTTGSHEQREADNIIYLDRDVAINLVTAINKHLNATHKSAIMPAHGLEIDHE